jgi:D-amino-acid dehydrogenase
MWQAAEQAARQNLPLGLRLDESAWLGSRPTLPDSRPMIGAAPALPDVWLALGHQHIGFSTGPGSGELLASLMSEEVPPIDPMPFSPLRFGTRWIR